MTGRGAPGGCPMGRQLVECLSGRPKQALLRRAWGTVSRSPCPRGMKPTADAAGRHLPKSGSGDGVRTRDLLGMNQACCRYTTPRQATVANTKPPVDCRGLWNTNMQWRFQVDLG